jgi:hypothetical protein
MITESGPLYRTYGKTAHGHVASEVVTAALELAGAIVERTMEAAGEILKSLGAS